MRLHISQALRLLEFRVRWLLLREEYRRSLSVRLRARKSPREWFFGVGPVLVIGGGHESHLGL